MATFRNLLTFLAGGAIALLMSAAASAQSPNNDQPSPVAYASVNELNNILAQVKQVAQNVDGDLAKTRIDKWKADTATKRDAQANVESIRRNVQSALPEVLTELNNSSEDLGASFKLYRNLDALYDVLGPLAESAGAFGTKDEFQSLSNDLNALQSARHALGDRMQNLAAAKESELARLRNQIKALQAANPPAPPKKIIVDDTEPPKKPVKKKSAKPAATPPAPAPANPQSPPPAK
jgi:hypothetical protein